MAEQFVDLSHHNTTVDLSAYAAAGHSRVVLKATEGTAFTDPAFPARWVRAGRAGLARGAYHFARTTASPGVSQADRLLAAVDAAGGLAAGDFLVLDLEDDTGLGRARAFAIEFCRQMAVRGHPAGLIYTRTSYASPARLLPADVPAGWRRLWLADYGSATDAAVALPTGWDRAHVAARQYTNRATVPGVGGPADYSRVLTDWLTPAVPNTRDEDDMVIVTAPHRAWLAYYPTSGTVRIIGPGEQVPLEKVHTAGGDPAKGEQLTVAEYDLLIRYADRPARGDVGTISAAVVTGLAQAGAPGGGTLTAADVGDALRKVLVDGVGEAGQ